MTIDEFVGLVECARRDRPVWFGLESDAIASDEEIAAAEAELHATLPVGYRGSERRLKPGAVVT